MNKTTGALVVAASLVSMLMSGCIPEPKDEHIKNITNKGWVAKPPKVLDPIPATDMLVPDECNNTIAVVGIGNPGHVDKFEKHTFYAADLISRPILVNTTDASVAPKNKFKTEEIKYASGIPAVSTFTDLAKPEVIAGIEAAKDSLIKRLDALDQQCPGINIVLRGHGLGASVIRLAASQMGAYRESNISAIWLSSDPSRNPEENIAVVPGTKDLNFDGRSKVVEGDGTAGGILSLSGFNGTGAPFSETFAKKTITTCYFNDPICNSGGVAALTTDFKAFYASFGDNESINQTHFYKYIGLPVTEPAADWVSGLVRNDSVDGAKGVDDINVKTAGYLNYVNSYIDGTGVRMKHPGASVIQDFNMQPSIVETCADYTVIGVRGSGEQIEGNEEDSNGNKVFNQEGYNGGRPPQENAPVLDGFSEFPATFGWEIKRNLPNDSTIRFVPVNYIAAPIVGTLLPSGVGFDYKKWELSIDAYFASAVDGASKTYETVMNVREKCPFTSITLIGYSQGAQAVHHAMSKINHSTAEGIASVILIADPIREPKDTFKQKVYDPKEYTDQWAGDESILLSSQGIAAVGPLSNYLTAMGKVEPYFDDKVIQVCDIWDLVCQSGALNGNPDGPEHVSAYRAKTHYEFPSQHATEEMTRHHTWWLAQQK